MAENIAVTGAGPDDKPLTPAVKTKVQNALRTALAEEFRIPTVVGGHYSITHISIVFLEE